MEQSSRSVRMGYILAVAAPAVVWLVLLIGSGFLGEAAPGLLFYSAIILAASYGGLKPGLLATTISAVATALFFLKPLRSLWINLANDWLDLLLFIGVAVLISWLCEVLHASKRRAEAERQRLEQEIAERKKLQQVLEEQNEQIELAQQAGGVGLWSVDLESGRRAGSKEWRELMGYTAETQPRDYAEWLAEAVHPDDRARLDAAYQAVVRGGADLDIEFRISDSKRGERWVASRGRVMQTNSKSGPRLLGVTADITERRQTEEKVRENEERLRLAQTRAHAGFWDWCPRTKELNRTAELDALYGFRPGSFGRTYKDWRGRVHPDDIAAVERKTRDAVANHEPFDVEFRIFHSSGQMRWLSARGGAIYDEAGEPVRVLGIDVDVTERKQVEIEIGKTQAAAEQHLAELDLLYRTAPVGLCLVDSDLRFVRINETLAKINGVPVTEHIGRTLREVLPDFADRLEPVYRHVLESGEAVCNAQFAGTTAAAPGDRRCWQLSLFPLKQQDGMPWAINVVVEDVTERKLAEEALKEADRRKDEFLATLAHELRNPLAPIRNAVEILRTLSPPEPRLQWCRDIIERQVEQMSRLMEDLLDVSRITRDRLKLRKEKVDLCKIIESAIETSRPLIDAAGHELTVNMPFEQIWLDADPIRLVQIFSNLLNNAAKYTVMRGRIWLTAEQQGSEVVVTVKDNGVGIPAELLPEIFSMFIQGQHGLERMRGGLGLGLTLARSLVEMHGGTIEAKSAGSNQGSEFIVRLRAADALPAAVAAESQSPAKLATRLTKRILIVEDSEDQARALAMLLELMGHQIRRVRDGASALQTLKEFLPDVALVDLGLPGMSGYDLARRIREQPRLQHLMLVAQSGWGRRQDRQRARRAGFDHHLVKPFDLKLLNDLLSAPPS